MQLEKMRKGTFQFFHFFSSLFKVENEQAKITSLKTLLDVLGQDHFNLFNKSRNLSK